MSNLKRNPNNETLIIDVFDMGGRLLLEGKVECRGNYLGVINVQSLSKGEYILRVRMKDQELISKIIKM